MSDRSQFRLRMPISRGGMASSNAAAKYMVLQSTNQLVRLQQ